MVPRPFDHPGPCCARLRGERGALLPLRGRPRTAPSSRLRDAAPRGSGANPAGNESSEGNGTGQSNSHRDFFRHCSGREPIPPPSSTGEHGSPLPGNRTALKLPRRAVTEHPSLSLLLRSKRVGRSHTVYKAVGLQTRAILVRTVLRYCCQLL